MRFPNKLQLQSAAAGQGKEVSQWKKENNKPLPLWVLPPSFPSDLRWQSQCSSLSLIFPPCHFSQFLVSSAPFCIFWHLPLQLSFLVPSQVYLLPKPWSCAAQTAPWLSSPLLFLSVPADRAHSIAPPKIFLTSCSSFLVESNLLLTGLMGLCEVWDWLLRSLPSFREPSIRTINQLSFLFQSEGKVFLSLHKCLLYMQKCMSAFCLQ